MTSRPPAARSKPTRRIPSREGGAAPQRLCPVAAAIAAVLLAGGGVSTARAQQAFSPAWFAAKGAAQNTAATTGRLPNGLPAHTLGNPSQQSQAARDRLQRSIDNLGVAAQAIVVQQRLQQQARDAARGRAGVPDGLAEGGLKVDADSLTAGWLNAKAPTQVSANGDVTVTIEQTADQAILNWETFNVGRRTTVEFQQDKNWAVLNRVNDPAARPSQIQGRIKADGTVLVLNRNGILFEGGSQVNVRNLVAAATAMTDAQFQGGLYGAGGAPTFTEAGGAIRVERGALIQTSEPKSVTQGGGYVLLLGAEVDNAGEIVTRQGQAALAAGDSFVIRKGLVAGDTAAGGTTYSTTRGNEIAVIRQPDSAASGAVSNTGLILAREGDVTLAGHQVRQQGVAAATTTVNARGTVHLLNAASDAGGGVALGKDAITAVLIEDDGKTSALDSQRDALIKESAEQDLQRLNGNLFDNYSRMSDRRDQSRIEIVSGGNVVFEGDSLTLATGGQIVVDARQRTFVADRARLDVSGAVGVNVAMESNNVQVNVQGNELRDSPQNRDGGKLANKNVWIDRRDLILMPAGTGGYESDRWYAAGGLLEVGGYLGNQGHRVGEWAAQGGTVLLGGSEVVTQAGSSVNLAGGTLDVQTGYVSQTWLRGADGKVYSLKDAPANLAYDGLYTGYHLDHKRWGVSDDYYSPIIAPQRRLENGYTVGRDAGRLVVSAPTAVLEGDIVADVFDGARQSRGRDPVADSYKLGQTQVARAGQLWVGDYGARGRMDVHMTDIRIGDVADVTHGLDASAALPSERAGTLWLDAGRLGAQRLGGLDLATQGSTVLDADIALADGGSLTLIAPVITVDANVVARGGRIAAGNLFVADAGNVQKVLLQDGASSIVLGQAAVLDVRGTWINQSGGAADATGLPFVDGGRVTLRSTGGVALAAGSRIDASSGAALLATGKRRGGKGGDITVQANAPSNAGATLPGRLVLDGELLGYGVEGGGTLSVGGTPVLIAGPDAQAEDGQLHLTPDFFRKGFSHYVFKGSLQGDAVTIAEGTVLDVEMPVYRLTGAAPAARTGDHAAALEIWTPPLYLEDPQAAAFTQRKGASLSFADVGDVFIGKGARIEVDPGQSISVSAGGQVTIDGRLDAWGGTIAINNGIDLKRGAGFVPGRSIWIGDHAVLDVASRAVTGLDGAGRPFGSVSNGGTIRIGVADLTLDQKGLPGGITPALVIVRPGAVLDASGESAAIDLAAGSGPFARSDLRTMPGHGGAIILASSSGLALDGTLRASGGSAAAGGSLHVILESAPHIDTDVEAVRQARVLTVTQTRQPSRLPADLQPGQIHEDIGYAQAWLGADQVKEGGFDHLSLWSSDILRFQGDVSLDLGLSLALQRGVISVADTTPQARISLAAPVVRLDGGIRRETSAYGVIQPILRGAATGGWLPAAENTGRLTVEADLIDVGDWVRFGASDVYDIAYVPGSHSDTITRSIEAPGFADIQLHSRGDIRLRTGSLASAGDVTLTASQVYPVTGATATIIAGARQDSSSGVQPHPDSILAIRGNGHAAAPPSSVFGALGFIGGTVDQGGVVRAPLGTVNLGGAVGGGFGFYGFRTGGHVVLREDSITSVSAAGLIIPYGGTVDGLKYHYNGVELSLPGLMDLDAMGRIEIAADTFEARAGSLLDLSGGGELAGAGFVAGRGGSVDILRTPIANANPAFGFSDAGNQVYAILPGYASAYAPVVQEAGWGNPATGQQVTLGAGIPGLAAGTYTLLPSTYARLPGAYRVEIGGGLPREIGTVAAGNGSYVADGYLGIANTPVRAVLPNQIVVTPGPAVRAHSQYNESSYSAFALATAARFGTTRARLPTDGKQLVLSFEEAGDVIDFNGTALFGGGEGSYAGAMLVRSLQPLEIKPSTAAATPGMTALDAEDLSRFNAGTLFIGAEFWESRGFLSLDKSYGNESVAVRAGSVLEAGQIVIAGQHVLIEDSAVLDTTRSTFAVPDSTLGYVFANATSPDEQAIGSMLVVANGWFNLLPAMPLKVGESSSLTIEDGAVLRTRGTIGFVASDKLSLGLAQLNARYLGLSLPAVNVGTEASLAAARAAGVLGTGWNLTQTTLDRLLNPATTDLAALERLSLSVRNAINFYGDVTLDARNQGGGPAETMVVLNTPAIYGWGEDSSATLAADTLVWNGVVTGEGRVENPYVSLEPPAVQPGGAGTGSGRLTFAAREIHFGYDPLARTQNSAELKRLALGFSSVDLVASEKITANNRGSVAFYHSGTDASSYRGGDLTLSTPLFTADSGAMIDIGAGGAITVGGAGDAAAPAAGGDLGGEIRLQGAALALDTAVLLPSGRLVMKADGDIRLGSQAQVDLAGRSVSFYDVTKHSWGGRLEMESRASRIVQDAGSVIDVSARGNDAGAIEMSAVAGTVALGGTLRGGTTEGYADGRFALAADTIGDFGALNTRLSESGFFGARRFTVKRGDLVVGNEVKAHAVEIAVDGGSLTVNGRIDASGEQVGSIRLSARDNLVLASGAALDAHGTVLRTDSHGAPIAAANRASIELTAGRGTITLARDAAIDLRSADGVDRGRLELNASRVGGGDVAIDAASRVDIRGAASIAVNAFRRHVPVEGMVDQAYLDSVHADSQAFMSAALANGSLQARLGGLAAYGSALHLRPGVEIASDGDLTTDGDLDLSGYRYGPRAGSGIRGSGEPGVLVLRAGGDLKINGSINDGCAPPPPTNDDYNWADGGEGRMWAVSSLLEPGSLSWSMRFVAGADLAASDTRAVKPLHTLGAGGDLVMDDKHIAGDWMLEAISVVRTGTGYLDLVAGRDYRHKSLFGVYTAGTALPGMQDYAGIRFTEGGGDVLVQAGRTLEGYSVASDLDTNHRRINEWLRWQDGAWGINFGAYLPDTWGMSTLAGFSGIGTLGGGNVHVIAGGDAGVVTPQNMEVDPNLGLWVTRSSGLAVTIGGGGYTDAGGTLRQTGGGDLVVDVGGRLNMAPFFAPANPGGGMLVNVRGDVSVTAATIGLVNETGYGTPLGYEDPRPIDPMRPYNYKPDSGLFLALGDSRATIRTRGDLVVMHVADPGRIDPAGVASIVPTISDTGASLWTDRTAVDLFSAGGSVVPISSNSTFDIGSQTQYYDTAYPPALSAVAAGGDVLVFGRAALRAAPGARLDLLARDSIFYGMRYQDDAAGNYLTRTIARGVSISGPTRIYAVNGDIINARVGQTTIDWAGTATGYIGGGPLWMRAGRDIVASGGLDEPATDWSNEAGRGGLILHDGSNNVSLIQAGRDIIYSNFQVAGPGTLALVAGRSIYQGDKGSVVSIGPVVAGDARPGASILFQAGAGASGPDYGSLLAYLDPANLARTGMPLADQPGKVAKTYEAELVAWLKERYGVEAPGEAEARAVFAELPAEQQGIFLRQVYFAELREGGREYNDADGLRFGSYLRGRQAIAALFPDHDAQGGEIARPGDIILFGGAGVRTNFGGDIEMLAPGGQIVVGVQGEVPPAGAGVMTQGRGDIRLFSEQSLLLGLSRVMTTFGGGILAWSEEGDINAGRGAKTTVLFTPPKRSYDGYGNVMLAPQAPSSGAGIATLNPIPEVPPGDVDLIAPLGAIDAGEAGIRVSGNVNLAALRVVNAENIQVQGKASGLPVAAVVNVSALTSASAAASSAATAAQEVIQRDRATARNSLPSIFSVRVLGFGNEPAPGESKSSPPGPAQGYRSGSAIQVLGDANMGEAARSQLTAAERRSLGL